MPDMGKSTPQARRAFALRLRAIRISKGFETAREFAKSLGVTENALTRWERAEVEPNLDTIIRICHVLEITPNDLMLAKKPLLTKSGR